MLDVWETTNRKKVRMTRLINIYNRARVQDGGYTIDRMDMSRLVDSRTILAGDFNATNDHAQMRCFAADGYVDGAARVGAGYLATYPSDGWRRPIVALDHVKTRGGPLVTAIERRRK